MPSAKSMRTQRRRAVRNRSIRTRSRSSVAAARASIERDASGADTAAAVKAALSTLDRAVTKGVLHRNNAARSKSRLAKRLNKALASQD